MVQRFCGGNEFDMYKKEERGQCGSNVVGQGNKNDFFFLNNKVVQTNGSHSERAW